MEIHGSTKYKLYNNQNNYFDRYKTKSLAKPMKRQNNVIKMSWKTLNQPMFSQVPIKPGLSFFMIVTAFYWTPVKARRAMHNKVKSVNKFNTTNTARDWLRVHSINMQQQLRHSINP